MCLCVHSLLLTAHVVNGFVCLSDLTSYCPLAQTDQLPQYSETSTRKSKACSYHISFNIPIFNGMTQTEYDATVVTPPNVTDDLSCEEASPSVPLPHSFIHHRSDSVRSDSESFTPGENLKFLTSIGTHFNHITHSNRG